MDHTLITSHDRILQIRFRSPEAREAMEAFLQKRKPDFTRFD